jgi:hypothetical protein
MESSEVCGRHLKLCRHLRLSTHLRVFRTLVALALKLSNRDYIVTSVGLAPSLRQSAAQGSEQRDRCQPDRVGSNLGTKIDPPPSSRLSLGISQWQEGHFRTPVIGRKCTVHSAPDPRIGALKFQ